MSNNKIATAGNKGERVRSDCFVTLEIKKSGGLKINLQSKVAAMFGDDIKQNATKILQYFEIKNAELTIEDSGALPFVILARIEAAPGTTHPLTGVHHKRPSPGAATRCVR